MEDACDSDMCYLAFSATGLACIVIWSRVSCLREQSAAQPTLYSFISIWGRFFSFTGTFSIRSNVESAPSITLADCSAATQGRRIYRLYDSLSEDRVLPV